LASAQGVGSAAGYPAAPLISTAAATALSPMQTWSTLAARGGPFARAAVLTAGGAGGGSPGTGPGVCLTGTGELAFCAPLVQPLAAGVTRGGYNRSSANRSRVLTTTGEPCNIPFAYRGALQWGCIATATGNSTRVCMTAAGGWRQCAPATAGRAGGGRGGSSGSAALANRVRYNRTVADDAAAQLFAGNLVDALTAAFSNGSGAAQLSALQRGGGGSGGSSGGGQSRALSMGLGIVLGLGGGLLLAAAALAVAVKRGVVYQLRSRRFQEAAFGFETEGAPGSGGGVTAAGDGGGAGVEGEGEGAAAVGAGGLDGMGSGRLGRALSSALSWRPGGRGGEVDGGTAGAGGGGGSKVADSSIELRGAPSAGAASALSPPASRLGSPHSVGIDRAPAGTGEEGAGVGGAAGSPAAAAARGVTAIRSRLLPAGLRSDEWV
jgi:hypothetical protein